MGLARPALHACSPRMCESPLGLVFVYWTAVTEMLRLHRKLTETCGLGQVWPVEWGPPSQWQQHLPASDICLLTCPPSASASGSSQVTPEFQGSRSLKAQQQHSPASDAGLLMCLPSASASSSSQIHDAALPGSKGRQRPSDGIGCHACMLVHTVHPSPLREGHRCCARRLHDHCAGWYPCWAAWASCGHASHRRAAGDCHGIGTFVRQLLLGRVCSHSITAASEAACKHHVPICACKVLAQSEF